MKGLLRRLIREEAGQDLIEYALLGGFISLAAILGITALGNGLQAWYNGVAGTVAGITPG